MSIVVEAWLAGGGVGKSRWTGQFSRRAALKIRRASKNRDAAWVLSESGLSLVGALL